MVWAEQIGLGELGLKPWEFWRLTPHEFNVMLDGFFRKRDRDWEMVGTLGLWVVSQYSQKKLTVVGLLGRQQLRTMPESRVALTQAQREALQAAEDAAAVAQAMAWATGGRSGEGHDTADGSGRRAAGTEDGS